MPYKKIIYFLKNIMKIIVPTTSEKLINLLTEEELNKLELDRDNIEYTLNIQNLGIFDIYIENNDISSKDTGYLIVAGAEREIKYKHIKNLQFISDGGISKNIRIIIT